MNKKSNYGLIGVALCILIIIFSKSAMAAALRGFDMWLNYVMPSVFPFFVCMTLMRDSGMLNYSTKSYILPLFISCGISGAPTGSRFCSHLCDCGIIPQKQLSAFCAICNMVSPIFIIGTLAKMAGTGAVIVPVLIGHYLCAFILLITASLKVQSPPIACRQNEKVKPFMQLLCDSISEGIFSSVRICGVIIFFTVLITLFESVATGMGLNIHNAAYIIIMSMFEMTNGCMLVCSLDISFPMLCGLLCFVISFGGLCIMAQAFSFADIRTKKYLQTKLLFAVFAGVISYCAARILPYEQSVFQSGDKLLKDFSNGSVSLCIIALSSFTACCVVWLFSMFRQSRKRNTH